MRKVTKRLMTLRLHRYRCQETYAPILSWLPSQPCNASFQIRNESLQFWIRVRPLLDQAIVVSDGFGVVTTGFIQLAEAFEYQPHLVRVGVDAGELVAFEPTLV